jgi:hypothetical protein
MSLSKIYISSQLDIYIIKLTIVIRIVIRTTLKISQRLILVSKYYILYTAEITTLNIIKEFVEFTTLMIRNTRDYSC